MISYNAVSVVVVVVLIARYTDEWCVTNLNTLSCVISILIPGTIYFYIWF